MDHAIYPWWVEAIGWCSAAMAIFAFQSRTMIPLRVAAIFGCAFALGFAWFRETTPTLVANAILLPLNIVRLMQMRRLIAAARAAVGAPPNYDWLRPFMREARFNAGETIFRKGDIGAEAWLVADGEVSITERDVLVGAGKLLGEIGFLTREHRRTASAVAKTDVRAWRVSFDDLEQLCIQNPAFCLHLASVIVQRYEANLP